MPVDYVGHILNAMIATSNSAHQKAQTEEQKVRDAEEQRSNKMREQYQQDALKQAQDIAERNFQHLQAQTDLEQQRQTLQQQIAHKEALHQMHQDVYNGITKLQPNQQQIDLPDLGVSIPQGSQIVDGEPVPTSSFSTNEDRLKNVEETAFRAGKGQFAGLKDPEEAQKAAAALKLAAQKEAADQREKALDRASRERVASIMAGARNGVDPDLISSLGEAAATGQSDLVGTSKPTLAARDYLDKSGQKAFPKKSSDALKSISGINSFFDDIKNFANKNLPESQTGALLNGIYQSTPIPTQAKNDLDILKQNAINVGKTIEGISGGRVTNKQLDLMINGMASTKKTRSQVIQDAEALKQKYLNSVNTTILGGLSPEQRAKILEVHGLSEDQIGGSKAPKELDEDTARQLLVQSGGDKAKARAKAKELGYEVK